MDLPRTISVTIDEQAIAGTHLTASDQVGDGLHQQTLDGTLQMARPIARIGALAQEKTITVFAAASLKNALDEIDDLFTKQSGIKKAPP